MTKKATRTKNSVRNTAFATLNFVVSILMKFVMRTIFLHKLSTDYLGLDSLFANILQILSLAELGIGSSIVYSMYKPVAEGDERKVRALNNLYRKIYAIIGAVVTAIGLSLTPFLNVFIGKTPDVAVDIRIVYLIFLFNTSVGYFFSYRRSLIYAYQRNDVETKVKTAATLLMDVCQIVALLLTANYYLYVVFLPIFTIIDAVTVYAISFKLFPHIRADKEKLDKAEKKEIAKNASAMLLHSLGNVAVFGTDNIIISAFLGLTVLGKYSNYYLIITGLNSGLTLIITAVKSSIGNLIATSADPERVYRRFKDVNFIFLCIIGFCTVCCFNLFQPFIALWVKPENKLEFFVMALLCVSFYLSKSRRMVVAFKECTGLFWNDRFRPLVEAAANLIASIILVNLVGLPGVVLGTIFSSVVAPLWWEPLVLYKHYFKKSVGWYLLRYLVYAAVTVAAGAATFFLCSLLPVGGWLPLLGKLCISAVGTVLIYCLAYFKTPEFKYALSLVKRVLSRKKRRLATETAAANGVSAVAETDTAAMETTSGESQDSGVENTVAETNATSGEAQYGGENAVGETSEAENAVGEVHDEGGETA